jgi:hypothetical protein
MLILQIIFSALAFLAALCEVIAWTILDRIHGFGWIIALGLLGILGYLFWLSVVEMLEERKR